MDRLMSSLKKRCPFLESRWFNSFYGITIALNPLAMLLQVLDVLTTKQVEGISISMFVIFGLIQATLVLGAIRTLDWKLWLSMLISVFETGIIIVSIVWIRHF